MSRTQRFTTILIGLLSVALGTLLWAFPSDESYALVTFLLSVSLILYGLRMLVYYFTMAKHMIGGKGILIMGLIIYDIGVFTYTLTDIPTFYIIIYLAAISGFTGLVAVMRALEMKRYHSSSWIFNMAIGVVNVIVAGLCLFNLNSERVVAIIFGFNLIYSGVVRILSAFRKTAIIYIQ